MNAEHLLVNTPRCRFMLKAKRNGWHCCWAHLTLGTKESGYTSVKLCSDLNRVTYELEFSPPDPSTGRPLITCLSFWPFAVSVI